MKVLVNGRYLHNSVTGIERVILELVYAFSEKNKDDDKNKDEAKNSANENISLILKASPEKYSDLCETIDSNKKFKNIYEKLYFDLYSFGENSFESGADIIIGSSYTVPFFLQIPSLCFVYDLSVFKFKEFYDIKTRLYFKYIVLPAIKRATGIITISKAVKRDIIDIIGIEENKIHVVYPPLSNEILTFHKTCKTAIDFDKGIRPEVDKGDTKKLGDTLKTPYFICPGSLHPRKNQHRLLKAFELFCKTSEKSFNLIISGHSNFFYPEFKETLKKIPEKICGKIIMTGYLEERTLMDMIYNSQTVIYPSIDEGFGFPPLEAMALGVPVVAGDCSAIKEVCGRDVIYCDPLRVESICDAMNKSIGNTHLRKSLIRQGRKRALKYNRENFRKKLSEIFSKYV